MRKRLDKPEWSAVKPINQGGDMDRVESHMAAVEAMIASMKELAQEVDKRHLALAVETCKRYDAQNVEMDKRFLALLQAMEVRIMENMAHRDRRIDERFDASRAAVQAAFIASEKAIDRYEDHSEKWRQSANEWRGAMDDRETKYAMKENTDAQLQSMHKEVDTLRENQRGEVTLLRETIRGEINQLRIDSANFVGKGQGMDKMWGYIIAAISAMGAIGITVTFVASRN